MIILCEYSGLELCPLRVNCTTTVVMTVVYSSYGYPKCFCNRSQSKPISGLKFSFTSFMQVLQLICRFDTELLK